jgi:hypothetical protein
LVAIGIKCYRLTVVANKTEQTQGPQKVLATEARGIAIERRGELKAK